MKKYLLALALSLCLCVTAVSCSTGPSQSSASTGADKPPGSASSVDLSSTADSAQSPSDAPPKGEKPTGAGTYFTTDRWVSVPMISQSLIDAGYGGGEACQQVLGLNLDSIDGMTGFFGTDVAGIYRTKDGGKTWALSTVGFEAAGATAFAIDPTNVDRVFCVGANSAAQDVNGIYRSIDGGDTWSYVFKARTYGYRNQDTQIAFDKTSYDRAKGYCTTVYWSREDNSTGKNTKNDPNIYKSTDGGTTWKKLDNTADCAGGDIAVNPENGHIYTANKNGVFVSRDGGKSFKKVLNKSINSMDHVLTEPDNIYCVAEEGMYISTDGGNSFEPLKGLNYPSQYANHLRVSPADPNRMMMQADWAADGHSKGKNKTYYTNNGGKIWRVSTRHTEGHWTPTNAAESRFAWSPTDPDKVIVNWNYINMSTNGGKDFYWSNTGFAAICCSGYTTFNVNNSDLIAISSQDYNGGYSLDGGKTWTYCNYGGKAWGGYTYGSYCLDEKTSVVAYSEGWAEKRYICVTHDGGKNFDRTDIEIKGAQAGMGALGNNKIAFIGEWRTTDGGYTWEDMSVGHGDGCNGVYTVDRQSGRLFGRNDMVAVYSDDNGATWKKIGTVANNITHMAFNARLKRVFVTTQKQLLYCDIEKGSGFKAIVIPNAQGNIASVAVDQKNPDIMYVCCSSNLEYNIQHIWRSLDGGKTWTGLCRMKGDGRDEYPAGARRASFIAINYNTSELFVFTGCHGVWKIAPPPAEYYE